MIDPLANTPLLLPIEDLFERHPPVERDGTGWRIVVSACTRCGRQYVPERPLCLVCGNDSFDTAAVAAGGVLYSFSTVHVSSSFPVPYTLGYVDLECDVRMLVHIDADAATLRCDQRVTCTGARGSAALFAPLELRAA